MFSIKASLIIKTIKIFFLQVYINIPVEFCRQEYKNVQIRDQCVLRKFYSLQKMVE